MTVPSPAARALATHLIDIADVVAGVDALTYRAARQDGVSGSIGAHVRHVLDHVAALVEPVRVGVVDYDTRRRDTVVEHDRLLAIHELRRLAQALEACSAHDERRPLRLSAVVSHDGERVESPTLLGRELVFVLSHTIHHQAIIALLLATAGRRTPVRFSLAPATPTLASCAPSA